MLATANVAASKRHLRLGKATYGHERFMITLQQLQNISHDPISGAQVRDLSSVNYTLAPQLKEKSYLAPAS